MFCIGTYQAEIDLGVLGLFTESLKVTRTQRIREHGMMQSGITVSYRYNSGCAILRLVQALISLVP